MNSPRSLVEELDGVPGLDTEAGMLYTAGRDSIYRPVLQKFIAFYGNGWQGLTGAGSVSDLQMQAHMLRGSAATVGATEISVLAHALESACEAGSGRSTLLRMASDIEADLASLTAELERRSV